MSDKSKTGNRKDHKRENKDTAGTATSGKSTAGEATNQPASSPATPPGVEQPGVASSASKESSANQPSADKPSSVDEKPATDGKPATKSPTTTTAAPTTGTAASADKSATSASSQNAASSKTSAGASSSRSGGAGNGSTQPPRKNGGGWRRLLLWLLALLLIAALIGAGLLIAQRELKAQGEENAALQSRVEELQEQLAANERQMQNLAQRQEQGSREQSSREQQLANRMDDIEQRLAEHSERLRDLSTTTREDWLLAEVEYLLKLANQRMMIERSTQAAAALLQQADQILRDLNDTRVTPLRRAIARDLSELKLAETVDLEGLYMRLASMAERVPDLPTLPERNVPAPDRDQTQQQSSEPEQEQPWWERMLGTAQSLFSDFDDYVRVREHGERPEPILPPDAAQYLQQNLRLMLEKAQLAAMREESQVYQRSLETAVQWAERFYPDSEQVNNFVNELEQLAEVDVQQNLPDITQSLIMVTQYIDRLHKLEGVDNVPEQGNAAENAETQP